MVQTRKVAGMVLVAALSFGIITGAARADNSITYPLAKWDGKLLHRIDEGPRYMPKDFDPGIPPPPANDSAETRKDLDAMLEFQKSERTPETIKQIHLEEDGDLYKIMLDQTQFSDPKAYPELYKFWHVVIDDMVYFVLSQKKKYERPRPEQLEPKLTTVIVTPPHASYPSGHAAQSWTLAQVLSMVDPDNRAKYEKMSMDIAHRREIAGVHYPSDGAASRQMVGNVLPEMMKIPKIAAMRDAAIAEVKAHQQAPQKQSN